VLLRVLTMNVQGGEGDPRRAEIIGEGIRRIDPDIAAFQEVLAEDDQDQLGSLLAGTGLRGTHQAGLLPFAMPFADRYGGAALAARWPYQVVEVLDQRHAGATDVPWCTLAARIGVPGLGDVLFIATTSSWRLSAEAAREQQAVALTDLDVRHRGVLPTIIAGDLNAAPESASIRFLTGLQSLHGRSACYHDAWAVAGDGPGDTWTDANPAARQEISAVVGQSGYRRRLDYILTGSRDAHPDASCAIRSAQLVFTEAVDGVWPSDHFGVLAELDVSAG
jgi:endonuclease/exonuclease/phosphatase family metal-dependent hydrolase